MKLRRPPAVAGMFYEADPARLRDQVKACLGDEPSTKKPFIGALVPHAGLMYSGSVAGTFYRSAVIPPRLVILCPNHTGLGRPAAINSAGVWMSPLGELPIDEDLAKDLMAEWPTLEEDTKAHAREHSLEVQLPFLQLVAPETRFVPVCLSLPTFERCAALGEAIGKVIAATGKETTGILASSDLNHYENQKTTLEKDQTAIDRILALDPRGLWDRVHRDDISMCGYMPATAMLVAARALGATRAELLRHATSGDVNGDYNAVVGYASIAIR